VEGFGNRHPPLPTHFLNPRDHWFDIVQNEPRRYSRRRYSARSEETRPHRVGLLCSRAIVGCAIDFDRQPQCVAIEVEHVPSCRVLTPEFEPARSLPQLSPQDDFGQRHFASEFASEPHRAPITADH